jgi:protein SCO1/2
LAILTAVARDPESGVSSGSTQLVFVSIDPERDTPERIRNYLSHFDRRILGLTGSRDAIGRFSREIGAGSTPVDASIDHSTSLFVLDPKGREAGVLLRPSAASRIIADLTILRHLHTHALISMAH